MSTVRNYFKLSLRKIHSSWTIRTGNIKCLIILHEGKLIDQTLVIKHDAISLSSSILIKVMNWKYRITTNIPEHNSYNIRKQFVHTWIDKNLRIDPIKLCIDRKLNQFLYILLVFAVNWLHKAKIKIKLSYVSSDYCSLKFITWCIRCRAWVGAILYFVVYSD